MDLSDQVEIKQEVISIDDEDELETEDVLQYFAFNDTAKEPTFTATSWDMSRDEVKNEIMLDCLIDQDDDDHLPQNLLHFDDRNMTHHHFPTTSTSSNRIPEQQEVKAELIIPDISDNHLTDNDPSTSQIQRKTRIVKLVRHRSGGRFRRGKGSIRQHHGRCGDHVKKINYLTEKVLKLEIKYLKARIKSLNDRVKSKDDEIAKILSTEYRCSTCRSSISAQQQPNQQSPQPSLQQPIEQSGSAEKIKIIQQQISLLLHAIQCQRGDNDEPCTVVSHCRSAKFVLAHIKSCQLGRSCGVKHCFSSRQILGHFKHCQRVDCSICLPFRLSNIRFQSPDLNMEAARPVPNVGHYYSNQSQISSQTPILMNHLLQHNVESPINSIDDSISQHSGTSSRSSMSQQQNLLVPGIGDGDFSVLVMDNQNRVGPNLSTLVPPLVQIPTATTTTKEWQQSMNPNVRKHVVHRFVKAIFPAPPGLEASLDRRVCNLIEYCNKVEGRIFEAANSRMEYLSFMAEEICKTQQEIERKRQQRKIQQQLQ